MDNQFTRALLGFALLTTGLFSIVVAAIWGIAQFPVEGSNWFQLIIIFMGVVTQILIYVNTVHEPIARWIKAPENDRGLQSKIDQWSQDYHELRRDYEEFKELVAKAAGPNMKKGTK